jgi:hypothetical protein
MTTKIEAALTQYERVKASGLGTDITQDMLYDALKELVEGLKTLADRGTGVDLTPTVAHIGNPPDYAWWSDYLRTLDKSYVDRINQLLGPKALDPTPWEYRGLRFRDQPKVAAFRTRPQYSQDRKDYA